MCKYVCIRARVFICIQTHLVASLTSGSDYKRRDTIGYVFVLEVPLDFIVGNVVLQMQIMRTHTCIYLQMFCVYLIRYMHTHACIHALMRRQA